MFSILDEKLNLALLKTLLGTMNFLNEITISFPESISFSAGRPTEHFFNIKESLDKITKFVEVTAKEQNKTEDAVLAALGQYGKTNGIINNLIVKMLESDERVIVEPDDIIITTGCQEAMAICIGGLFQRERDVLLVSDPTYIGITGLASIMGIEVRPIVCNEFGLDLHALEETIHTIRKLGKTPKALYIIPSFNNPLGITMPLEMRKQLLKIAYSNEILILEDNAYNIFRYEGKNIPTLKSIDTTKSVIHLGTFSKSLFPGLRMGYLVADQIVKRFDGTQVKLSDELSKIKSLLTVNTSPILQAIVGGYLLDANPSFASTNTEKIRFYKANRDCMLHCLEKAFPKTEDWSKNVYWNRPEGGFFLTVTLPFVFDDEQLFRCAKDYKVICCPMSYFSIMPGHEKRVRLSFSYVNQIEIEKGILQFASFVRDTVKHRDTEF